MKLPVIKGTIDRRILVNFRIERQALEKFLPPPFTPKLHKGYGIGGICLIRFKWLRPKGLLKQAGVSSENGAHRFAVEWKDDEGNIKEGVYISRRDTGSKFNALTGGKLFPGIQHYSEFISEEENGKYKVKFKNKDDDTYLRIEAEETGKLPQYSIFENLESVSNFFEKGSIGYSPKRVKNNYEGLELVPYKWDVTPLNVKTVKSSFFDSGKAFPKETITFDNAILMKEIEHEWHSLKELKSCE